jgi:hypothetical protein
MIVFNIFTGLPCVRVDWRRSGPKEFPVSGKHYFRPKRAQVQLVVLRGLRLVQEVVRLQHPRLQELPAYESSHFSLLTKMPMAKKVKPRRPKWSTQTHSTLFVGDMDIYKMKMWREVQLNHLFRNAELKTFRLVHFKYNTL